jgi:hypothetical protein
VTHGSLVANISTHLWSTMHDVSTALTVPSLPRWGARTGQGIKGGLHNKLFPTTLRISRNMSANPRFQRQKAKEKKSRNWRYVFSRGINKHIAGLGRLATATAAHGWRFITTVMLKPRTKVILCRREIILRRRETSERVAEQHRGTSKFEPRIQIGQLIQIEQAPRHHVRS